MEFDLAYRLKTVPSDKELQDYCDTVRKRIHGLNISRNPGVSINICAHNEELYLPGTLDSISKLQTQIPMEIIMIDNASTDRTGEIARQCGITVVREQRKGLSYARQSGLLSSKGEYIFSTDADVRIPSGWIDSNLKYFHEDPNTVCISGGVAQNIHPLHKILRVVPKIIRRLALTDKDYKAYVGDSFAGGNMVYKREKALLAGGYNPGNDLGEDKIISNKLAKYGTTKRISDTQVEVSVSSRRVNSVGKVLGLYASGLFVSHWFKKGSVFTAPSRTFTDIR